MNIESLSSLIKPLYPKDEIGLVVVTSLIVVLIGALNFMKGYSRRNPFPNATPFPFNQTLIGQFLYIYVVISKFYNGEVSSYFRSLRKKLGCVFYLGPVFSFPHKCPSISLHDPKDQANFIRREKELELKVLLPDTVKEIHGERNIQALPVGKTHATLRKVYSSILSPRSLEAFTTIIVKEFQTMWKELEAKKDEVEIQTAIRERQLKIMCEILYGLGSETEEDRQVLTEISNDFTLTEKALFAVGGTKSKECQEGVEAKNRINKILYKKFDSIFDKRIAQIAQEEGGQIHVQKNESIIGSAMDQIVDSLIQAGCTSREESKQNGDISYHDARVNLYMLLEASHLTTMTVTSSIMYFLNHSKNQEVLDKVRNDVRSLEPTYQSLKEFSFGGACVQETMRLAPFVGTASYVVPKGKHFKVKGETIYGPIVVQFQHSNWYQDQDVFEEASSFKPERWLPGGQHQISQFAKSIFHPFGNGRHKCLGAPLARLVMNANLYCFASNPKRSIVFDEEKVKVVGGLFPEMQVCNNFMGKVAVEE